MSSEDTQSFRVTTVTSETVILSSLSPSLTGSAPSQSTTNTGTGSATLGFTEITITTEFVLTIPVTAAPTPPSDEPGTTPVPTSSTPSSLSSGRGSLNTSVLIPLVTIVPLLAAMVTMFVIFRCRRRRGTSAKLLSVTSTTSEGHLEAQECLECPQPAPPSELLGPELGDAPDPATNVDVTVAQSQQDVNSDAVAAGPGSITPFVKHYHSVSPSPDAALPLPRKGSAGTSRARSAGTVLGGNPPGFTAQDGMDADRDPLQTLIRRGDDARRSVGHSTAPPPYSQVE